ncbi:hypothetical protein JTE88_01135 [Arcanobacterium phocisimile]|uniref:Uncharacterized protein n=1 Tax=Arcanobacterium phocisimile TaxID=1302235 RepID=A0ABX7IKN5_9ACTO|nr:hypothetical protein [Arcanobacterium phocisimile]QRV02393.1 hypothetical protein JTE88_01135 [Arcanobacterium phocisimile]
MNVSFRRPAQLRPEQLEVIDGDVNIEARLELAYATAHALIPLDSDIDHEVTERLHQVIADEGIDVVAESWVDAPETSLPGILWRGFLLREWIRRFPDDVRQRFIAAEKVDTDQSGVLTPVDMMTSWDQVFSGSFSGDFLEVIRHSARFTDYIASIEPLWIADDDHPLATEVTRRNTAMVRTAQEFYLAGEKAIRRGRM